jgi:hypothetical protein
MKLEFSIHIFEKYYDVRFNVNLSSAVAVVACGRTDRRNGRTDGHMDRHHEANSRFSEFWECAYKQDKQDTQDMKGWNRFTGFRVHNSVVYCEHINSSFVSIKNGKCSWIACATVILSRRTLFHLVSYTQYIKIFEKIHSDFKTIVLCNVHVSFP